MRATIAFASVVRNPNNSCSPSTGLLFGPRSPCQRVHKRAKAKRGLSSLIANQVGVLSGFVSAYSQNEVAGTMQRLPTPSQPRPVRARDVADVGHRLAAVLRRATHMLAASSPVGYPTMTGACSTAVFRIGDAAITACRGVRRLAPARRAMHDVA